MNDLFRSCLGAMGLMVVACAPPGGQPVDETANDEAAPDETAVELAVFTADDGMFSTSDVYDVDGEIVQFDTTNNQLIWLADDLAFDGWPVNGTRIGTGFFSVLFGSEEGERRAYFTETATRTICNIGVSSGRLRIQPTSTPVPQS